MAIKRYIANADTTITNAYKSTLTSRGTGSNMGESDVLEVFSIFGQASTSSVEKSRALINFPISTISTDRTNGDIPESGSVKFFLKCSIALTVKLCQNNSTSRSFRSLDLGMKAKVWTWKITKILMSPTG